MNEGFVNVQRSAITTVTDVKGAANSSMSAMLSKRGFDLILCLRFQFIHRGGHRIFETETLFFRKRRNGSHGVHDDDDGEPIGSWYRH
jgi:hypothetical protein